jgi:hypothetical protein
MISPSTKYLCLGLMLVLLAGAGSFPVLAADPEVDIGVEKSRAGMPDLLTRLLGDPHRDYSSVKGPDDCNSEELYHGTKEQLGEYAASPMENKAAMKDYILGSEEQCNCTRAIVGKNFDILIYDLGLSFPQLPCL